MQTKSRINATIWSFDLLLISISFDGKKFLKIFFSRKKNEVVQINGLVRERKCCDLGQQNSKIKNLPLTKIFNFVWLILSLMNNMDYSHSQSNFTDINSQTLTNTNSNKTCQKRKLTYKPHYI